MIRYGMNIVNATSTPRIPNDVNVSYTNSSETCVFNKIQNSKYGKKLT